MKEREEADTVWVLFPFPFPPVPFLPPAPFRHTPSSCAPSCPRSTAPLCSPVFFLSFVFLSFSFFFLSSLLPPLLRLSLLPPPRGLYLLHVVVVRLFAVGVSSPPPTDFSRVCVWLIQTCDVVSAPSPSSSSLVPSSQASSALRSLPGWLRLYDVGPLSYRSVYERGMVSRDRQQG